MSEFVDPSKEAISGSWLSLLLRNVAGRGLVSPQPVPSDLPRGTNGGSSLLDTFMSVVDTSEASWMKLIAKRKLSDSLGERLAPDSAVPFGIHMDFSDTPSVPAAVDLFFEQSTIGLISVDDVAAQYESDSPYYLTPDERDAELNWLLDNKDAPLAARPGEPSSASATSAASDAALSADHPLWLKSQVEQRFSGATSATSPQDLCRTVFEILSASSNEAELQSNLFELLGMEHIDFISLLLANRQHVVDTTLQRLAAISASAPPALSALSALSAPSAPALPSPGPALSSSIIIQSEQEKRLQKQLRKEARKAAVAQSRQQAGDGDQSASSSSDALLQALGFGGTASPREQREAALRAASSAPLFSVPGVERSLNVERYPHVYDSLVQANKSSSLISGQKMLLPLGTTRKDTKIWEEVFVPPSPRKPMSSSERLVPISELDPVSQIAFPGYRTLNRIQSILFDTAFNSNENLLVCAPTGAGKTNVAMLTILHEIKQHLSPGNVIRKDEFKIVYVAPMKALAAEMVENFGKRLAPLGISVRELTGDMQLTKAEILATQMLVTTPEKWDVVTRKSTGDVSLSQIVRLLIIDEVHLLHDDRGPVIESIVARTLRQVETSQSMIRIVGLSATLPNYLDVASFLRVNPYKGLFYFDSHFRPVPLSQRYIGVKATNIAQQTTDMNQVCFDHVLDNVRQGHQVMVFVHARNHTLKTAQALRDLALAANALALFSPKTDDKYPYAEKLFSKSRNKVLHNLFADGFSIHHAGMLRQDRNLVEQHFAEGLIKVLVCTATLAWGVNLPAHCVIIKGTQLYDPKKGSFVDLGVLDVMQIFGRAGRPQFDTHGEGIIITPHDRLAHYLSLMTHQVPIESQFINQLDDNLNAEVALGTVASVPEAVQWLSYTYLYIRMLKNPLVYGLTPADKDADPALIKRRTDLVALAARKLDKAHMLRFNERTGSLSITDLGRTASHYYIRYTSMELFNEKLRSSMNDIEVLSAVSQCTEFENLKVRDEETDELDKLLREECPVLVEGGSENAYGKVNILLQAFVSNANIDNFALVSDAAYVAQNSSRILRALFEIAVKKGWPQLSAKLLSICKTVEKRMWPTEHPLRQFPTLTFDILSKLTARRCKLDMLRDMGANEIGHLISHVRMGPVVKACVNQFPTLSMSASVHPITRTVLKVTLTVTAEFDWNDRVHGSGEPWWIWIEDAESEHMYHSEYLILQKKDARGSQSLVFTIPIFEPLPPQYYVRAISDKWHGAEYVLPLSFKHLILPERHPPHTELLDLQPLPKTALRNPLYESLYRFSHFNPIQTQVFHTLYHTDHNVLLGAPTGSGKTIVAELAAFRVFNEYPHTKVVYIAPLKALVRERMDDWLDRLQGRLGKKVVELTGDFTPDLAALQKADVIVTTPEKWDGISRSWQNRAYVKAVSLIIIDEIHLLGDDRGPVLEVIVSRTNFISASTNHTVRVVGLSTALANARDLADWLGIEGAVGLFNFRPSVRPVPLEVHISGFPGKHYCPRMATMNKPTYAAIREHSPAKPALVFVSSRRQTRLTAMDLISYCAKEDNPKQFLHMDEAQMDSLLTGVHDSNLKLCLSFGIGLHHAGLHEKDRRLVEELFVNQRIQILIATSTLAWGVNFPAHLVVVKGTEYYDGKTKRYVDFPITDVLQMMGRAGRPQFDDQGVAVILVHDVKKHFYKKFLYEPFPVESNLAAVLPDHLNAEIVAGTISSKQHCVDYLTWTYFFRRLLMNPSYYDLELDETFTEEQRHAAVSKHLSTLIEDSLAKLVASNCIEVGGDMNPAALKSISAVKLTLSDAQKSFLETQASAEVSASGNVSINPTSFGRIASYYYLKHETVGYFLKYLSADLDLVGVLNLLTHAQEYAELPVRHNEDELNRELAEKVPLPVKQSTLDSPHTKAFLLLQAHFSKAPLPIADYVTDTKSVLDQAVRVCQAMIDISAESGYLATTLHIMNVVQMVIQGLWISDSPMLMLPHFDVDIQDKFVYRGRALQHLPELLPLAGQPSVLQSMLAKHRTHAQITELCGALGRLPVLNVSTKLSEEGPLTTDSEYAIKLTLAKENTPEGSSRGSSRSAGLASRAYAPRFPKPQDEGWWIVLGDASAQSGSETGELLALKRVSCRGRLTHTSLAFFTPDRPGKYSYTLYVISDCYVGLDQQYEVSFECIDAASDL